MIGKIFASDKMIIQTLHELGWGYRRIVSKFPDKQLNLQSVKNIIMPTCWSARFSHWSKTRHYSKTWSLTNCALISQSCLIRFLLFLVSPGSVETWLRWSDVFYNCFVEYSFLFPLMQKVLKFTKKCGSYNNFRSGVFFIAAPCRGQSLRPLNWVTNFYGN